MEQDSRQNIRHYIGRLCAARRASIFLANSAADQPLLFHGHSVRFQTSSAASKRPSPYGGLTLHGITGRMFPNASIGLQHLREVLQSLEENGSIMSRIMEYYSGKTWQPRVHAEMDLLETLHDNACSFYSDDKYIACSKAACFCCCHYICCHPGSFARPSCHNKVYINWSPSTPSTM